MNLWPRFPPSSSLIACLLAAGAGMLAASASPALGLIESLELARSNDPVFQAATYEKLAQDSSLRIAWSSLLPSASAEAGYTRIRQDVQSSDNQVFAVGATSFPVKTYGATLTQPLFRMTDWAEVSQARASVKQAAAELDRAFQDLLFRTADAYFTVLEARDEYEIRRREREALEQQSEISQRRLESGLGIAPDVYESEARFALAEADEAIARVDFADAVQALAEIIGRAEEDLRPLEESIPLAPPEPANAEVWVRTARAKSPFLEARRQAVVVSDREIDKQRGAHLPTVDFTASINNRDTDGSLFGGGSQVEEAEYGVQVRVPIFSGGAALFGTQRARSLHRRNEQQLVQAMRQVERETRSAFQAVISVARRVQALRKSVEVQQRAVEGREKSVRAGVDSMINVLNAKRELYAAMRDYARGRYAYIRSVLRLEQSAGALGVEDLEQISEWLR
ncbi:MAG: TolC family outer membrane protein [bacterium]